jgi:hypothetical protein
VSAGRLNVSLVTSIESGKQGIRIGLDVIHGQQELCLLAIGTGQPIGRCVGRDPRSGRFVSLTRRLPVGAYTEAEPVELERRPNPRPRPAPAVAARIVLALTLMIVTATSQLGGQLTRLAAWARATAAAAGREAARYLHREFLSQWRFALALLPLLGLLAWLACR